MYFLSFLRRNPIRTGIGMSIGISWLNVVVDPLTISLMFACFTYESLTVSVSLQSHPLSLCNTSEDERPESDFITIVKLESPESKVPQCQPLLDKVRPMRKCTLTHIPGEEFKYTGFLNQEASQCCFSWSFWFKWAVWILYCLCRWAQLRLAVWLSLVSFNNYNTDVNEHMVVTS